MKTETVTATSQKIVKKTTEPGKNKNTAKCRGVVINKGHAGLFDTKEEKVRTRAHSRVGRGCAS